MKLFCSFHIALVAVAGVTPRRDVTDKVDWAAMLGRSDLTWTWLSDGKGAPTATNERASAFAGNGDQGFLLRANGTNGMVLTLGRTTLYDDQPWPSQGANFVQQRPRLPIGSFSLTWGGQLTNATMRLSLQKAEVSLQVATQRGALSLNAFTNAATETADVHILTWQTDGDENLQIAWSPLPADAHQGGAKNPDPVTQNVDNIKVTTWQHLSGTSHAVAWATGNLGNGQQSLVICATNVSRSAGSVAHAEITKATRVGVRDIRSQHRQWWNTFWPQSFLSLGSSPDDDLVPAVEQQYYINMYKWASASRTDRAPFDLEGPWYIAFTHWPDMHWDLNIQETYYTPFTANHVEDLGASIKVYLDKITPNLIQNVPKEWRNDSAAAPTGASALDGIETCYWKHGSVDPETGMCLTTPPSITGNLLWSMHNYYLVYSKTLREDVLRDMYPLLRRAVNYHTHFAHNVTSGEVHLPPTFSPEYATDADVMYDLALWQWGLQTAIDAADSLGLDEPLVPLWKDLLARFTSFPVGENGLKIAANTELKPQGHRHYSHLFPVFPLMSMDLSDSANMELAQTSVDWWCSRPSRSHYEVASSMQSHLADWSAAAGQAEAAALRRQAAFTNITFNIEKRFTANTFYYEGSTGSCGESSPGTASAVLDMLLLSKLTSMNPAASRISVFPGVDENAVNAASFHKLLADGGIEVSALRNGSSTRFVRLANTGPLTVEVTLAVWSLNGPWAADPVAVVLQQNADGTATFSLASGDTMIVFEKAAPPSDEELVLREQPAAAASANYWGSPIPAPPPAPSPPASSTLMMADCAMADHWTVTNISAGIIQDIESTTFSTLRTGNLCMVLVGGKLSTEVCGTTGSAEKFEITDWTQGFFRIKEPSEKQCLQANHGSAKAGSQVLPHKCSKLSDGIDKRGNEYWQLSEQGELLNYRSPKSPLTCVSRISSLVV